MDSNLSNVIDYIKYVFNIAWYVLKVMCYLATSKVCITESYCVPISLLKHKTPIIHYSIFFVKDKVVITKKTA